MFAKILYLLCIFPKRSPSLSRHPTSSPVLYVHVLFCLQCSEDCGSGIMSRKVYCITDSGRHLPDEKCDLDKKPSDEKTCSQNTPCSGRWFTGPWSKVSFKLFLEFLNAFEQINSLLLQVLIW